jgi:putative Mn2+ efflux pump MntP
MVFMHVLSVVLGTFFAYLIPKWIIEILVIILFTLFGLFFIFKAFRAPNKRKEKKPENSHDQA